MKVQTIENVIKMIFSANGIFQCIEQAYKEAPLTIVDILAQ